jgi:hypothetical protein
MYFRSGDPLDDFDRYDRMMASREARLPVCDRCHQRINEDEYFDIEGEILCEDCMRDRYSRSTEDYLRDNY